MAAFIGRSLLVDPPREFFERYNAECLIEKDGLRGRCSNHLG